MKKNIFILTFFVFSGALTVMAQPGVPTGFWKVYSIDGEIKLNGLYRVQHLERSPLKDRENNKILRGGINLHAKNYIWHPRFMMIDVTGEYSPSKEDNNYLVIPDRSENLEMKKAEVRLYFLPQNKFSANSFFSYSSLYNNRENLTNIKSHSSNWGASVSYRTKKIPLYLSYARLQQNDREIKTGRGFENLQHSLQARANTSFLKYDKQELILSHNEYYRKDFNNYITANDINHIDYNSQLPFGKIRQNNINSFLSGIFQRGIQSFSRYQVMEHFNSELTRNLRLGSNYSFFYEKRPTQLYRQHRIGGNLRHQLYKSLHTMLEYNFTGTQSSYYRETMHIASGSIQYTKKILKKHSLDLAYQYTLQPSKWKSADGLVRIIDEPVTLVDGQITLLSKPSITPGSIQVKDLTGTVFYQLNLDYLLILQNNFTQIQRIPGGQIPDNSKVYVDYEAVQPGNYQYISSYGQSNAALNFFEGLFGIYYRKTIQGYRNLKQTDFITLNYIDRDVMGVKFDKKAITAGIEYDNMKSTVLPYELYRYYFNLQGVIKKKLFVSFNGSFSDYRKMNDVKNIEYMDAAGSAGWQINPKSILTLLAFYRKQKGPGVDLDMVNCTAEFKTSVKKIFLTVTYNYYDRLIFAEKLRFNSLQVQLSRKF